jgi:asparagine synthase (glutamine-hydrolysing)
MCGIAGILQKEPGRFTTDHVKKMAAALAHRGPDGQHEWSNESGSVLFGHRRLSIIDLTTSGTQPMNYMNRYTVMHNGEIYNYVELRQQLEEKGYQFRSQTDTEVIAASYAHWKDKCVDQFDGMFAFVVWDKKEELFFAARDRFGEKPFFYSAGEGSFLFASEMKALWAIGSPRIPNKRMLFNFITIGYTDNPEIPGETFFENIYSLPPASFLYYKPTTEAVSIENYWTVQKSKPVNMSDEEAIDRFSQLLTTSIKRRLRSDVAIGSSLSGGLDSSAITALAHSFTVPQQSQYCFTGVFPGFSKNELQYATSVVEAFKMKQATIGVTVEGLIADYEKLFFHQEEPVGSASAYAQFKVYELAKQHNVTVILDGQGADETLAGYHKYYKWYWQELFRKGKLKRSGELNAARTMGINEKFGLKNMIAAWFPGFASVVLEKQYLVHAINHPDLARDFVKSQSREAYYSPPDSFDLNGVLHFNTFTHGLGELLRLADRNSMAWGREVRLPYLSHELVEFIFSLSSGLKIRNGWSKWLLRKSMDKILPPAITWRKDKVGFEPPQKTWMQYLPLEKAINDAKKKLVDHDVLKSEVLQKPVNPHDAYASDQYDWRYFSAAFLFS